MEKIVVTLEDRIEIRTPPEEVFKWLRNLDKHYREWHPDHVKWVTTTGDIDEGGIFYFEEYLHGKLHRIRGKITKVEENRRIEYRVLFPMSTICPKGSFFIEPEGESSIFTATLSFRLGGMFLKLLGNRVKAVKNHMREESENLKRLLERDDS